MASTVKVSDVRKALKTAVVKFSCYPSRGCSVLKGHVYIGVPSDRYTDGGTERYLEIEAQANDLTDPDRLLPSICKEDAHPNSIFPLYKVGAWYAAKVETQVSFGFGVEPYYNPDRAAVVAKLVKDTIKEYNLDAVYRECEISRICVALEKLGATVDKSFKVDREDSYSWNERRRERYPDKE